MGAMSLLSVTTISQYMLFGGIVLALFGWFEKKEKLCYAGQVILLLSGVFAVWVLLSNTISIDGTNGAANSKETKILGFLKMLPWFAVLNCISLLLGILKVRYYKTSLFIVILAALGLFFVVFNLQQIPATPR